MGTDTEQIREAVRAIQALRAGNLVFSASVTAAVKELSEIAISDADQETRVRLVTEFADTFEVGVHARVNP